MSLTSEMTRITTSMAAAQAPRLAEQAARLAAARLAEFADTRGRRGLDRGYLVDVAAAFVFIVAAAVVWGTKIHARALGEAAPIAESGSPADPATDSSNESPLAPRD
jgi:hypothetical protein